MTTRWGILATGRIARDFATNLHSVPGAAIAAVGSRSLASAEAFARAHGDDDTRAHASYADLVADPDVDVVYVASPHSLHLEHARLAFAAGKPVLCEKPLTLNRADGEALFAAAGDLFCMEAMWMACHPLVREVQRRLHAGDFGTPRQLHADLGFVVPETASTRMVERDLGAGALLDMGIYPLTFARLMLGPAARVAATADLAPGGYRPRRRGLGDPRGRCGVGADDVDDLGQPLQRHHRHGSGPARHPGALPPSVVRRVDAERGRPRADRDAVARPRHRARQRGRPRAGLPARRCSPRARWCPAPRPWSCSTSWTRSDARSACDYDADGSGDRTGG